MLLYVEVMKNDNENQSGYFDSRWVRRAKLFALLLVTAYFRFFNIGLKPPHFDEGINGHFVMTIWRDGFYTYDPTNFHGPLYFYLCHLAEILLGRSIDSFRLMNAVIALALVFAIYQFKRFRGLPASLAAWTIALSPAFTFYGRYAIHETLFILGQVLFVYGRMLWMGKPTRASVAWMATGTVILLATKETFVIFFGTWLIAELSVGFIEKLEKSKLPWGVWRELTSVERRDLTFDLLSIISVAALTLAALFTGFFETAQGISDFFKAFTFWSKTGMTTVSGHQKPWSYWFELLWRYEWPLLFGLVVAIIGFICLSDRRRKQRLLLLFGFGHFLAYTIVPYKTPWLILNLWPLAFFGLPAVSNRIARNAYVVLLIVVFTSSVYRANLLNFVNFTNPNEPYVYVQTTQDYSNVMDVLHKKIERAPETQNDVIVVMVQDPWPLPYDLSLYPKMRYAKLDDLVKDPDILKNASLVLVDGSALSGLRNVFPKKFARMKFQLRDAYDSGWALFDAEEFKTVLPLNVEIEGP